MIFPSITWQVRVEKCQLLLLIRLLISATTTALLWANAQSLDAFFFLCFFKNSVYLSIEVVTIDLIFFVLWVGRLGFCHLP